MSLMKINLRHLNQSHILKQAQPICGAGTCSEEDILKRLLEICDLYDINLDIVKCNRSTFDLSSLVVWLVMVTLVIAVTHALCAISRRCERVLGRRSKGNTLNCDWAAYSGCTSSAN